MVQNQTSFCVDQCTVCSLKEKNTILWNTRCWLSTTTHANKPFRLFTWQHDPLPRCAFLLRASSPSRWFARFGVPRIPRSRPGRIGMDTRPSFWVGFCLRVNGPKSFWSVPHPAAAMHCPCPRLRGRRCPYLTKRPLRRVLIACQSFEIMYMKACQLYILYTYM